uniref:Fibronectin type-III domain-containing protein n=1 Tax=Callorhinchus milii TaxID=7868 RepID=A0A4W3JJX5_CALMI
MQIYYVSGPPTSPERFMYTERTKSTVTLDWKPPRNDGGSPIIGYIIEKKKQDTPEFDRVNKQLCRATNLLVENLAELHMYEFRVKAVNEIGESEPSLPLNVVIQDDEVPPTVKLLVKIKRNTISVKAGEPIDIPAEVEGLPLPKIEWKKGETVIGASTDQLKMHTEILSRTNAKTKIHIAASVRKDTQLYTITGSNRLGTAFQSVNVVIFGKKTKRLK